MSKKVITESMIVNAIKHTNSNNAAAKYLKISVITYRKYASIYIDKATGKTLYELKLNKSGKGVSKPRINSRAGEQVLRDFLEKGINVAHYNIDKIKKSILQFGLLANECGRCKYCERRTVDNKIPLLLAFKDGDKKNTTLKNLELLCYNCYYLYVGDIFTKRQVKVIEDVNSPDVRMRDDNWDVDIDFVNLMGKSMTPDASSGEEYISKY